MNSLQGYLLIASPQLLDPNFEHTVLLMVQHDEQGALGLVLNRPLDTTVAAAVAEAVDVPCHCAEQLHQGGPCEGPLMVVHTHEDAGEIEALPGIYFSTDTDKVKWLLEHNQGAIKFFTGYAGWGAGQLEGELAAGGWYVARSDVRQIFDDSPLLWRRLVAQIALGRRVNPNIIPEDPSAN
jgi:putative transcriptional regulator